MSRTVWEWSHPRFPQQRFRFRKQNMSNHQACSHLLLPASRSFFWSVCCCYTAGSTAQHLRAKYVGLFYIHVGANLGSLGLGHVRADHFGVMLGQVRPCGGAHCSAQLSAIWRQCWPHFEGNLGHFFGHLEANCGYFKSC